MNILCDIYEYNIYIRQMLLHYQLIVLCLCYILAVASQDSDKTPKIQLEKIRMTTKAQLMKKQQLSHVLVETDFVWTSQDSQKYKKMYFVVHGADRNKKKAFNLLTQRYRTITEVLTRQKIIPNPESLIYSIVHQRYIRSKRQWRFSRYFAVVFGIDNSENEKEEAEWIYRKIKPYYAQKIKPQGDEKVVNYLNEKQLALQAFLEAKDELQSFIHKQLNNEYVIVQTKDIEFQGKPLSNEEIIEEDIEHEEDLKHRIGYMKKNPDNWFSEEEHQYSNRVLTKKQNRKIKIKVLFEIADSSIDLQEYFEQLTDKESESDDDSEKSIDEFEQENDSDEYGTDEDIL